MLMRNALVTLTQNGPFYIGCTRNLGQRVEAHRYSFTGREAHEIVKEIEATGGACDVVTLAAFPDRKAAIERENELICKSFNLI